MALAMKILQHEGSRKVMGELVDQANTQPQEDWVCRPSPTVKKEPRSLVAVFVPRDQKRKGVFLPYVMYAYNKLVLHFLSKTVQDEMRAFGYDPSDLALPTLFQVVAGARDKEGAVGRERTVSFSARIAYSERRVACNVVFGLPLLATRPRWNDRDQAVKFTFDGFDPGGSVELTAANTRVEWQGPAASGHGRSAGPERFCQTHKAVLIPEKGIVYEEIDLRKKDKPVGFSLVGGREDVYAPLDLNSFGTLLTVLGGVCATFSGQPDYEDGIRLDGVLTEEKRGAGPGKPMLVGVSPL
jgi:hypothetical protein